MKNIEKALNNIYCSVINDVRFDLPKKEILFCLTLVDNGETTYHTLKFINCRSFMWIEKPISNHDLYDYRNCDYYELTEISIKKINTNSDDEWLKQYPMEYNIAIEIWETALLINATELLVDQKNFKLP